MLSTIKSGGGISIFASLQHFEPGLSRLVFVILRSIGTGEHSGIRKRKLQFGYACSVPSILVFRANLIDHFSNWQ
jgi:hypothetical protein